MQTDLNVPLFRAEARHPSQRSTIGAILVSRPRFFTLLSSAACATAVAILCLLVWGTYTKRSTSSGQLLPDLGLIKVHAPQFGTIVEKNVTEGQLVQRGQVLYVLTSERRSSAFGDTQAMISQQVMARVRSLREQIANAERLRTSEIAAAHDHVQALERELTTAERLVEGLRLRVRLAQEKEARHAELRRQGFISEDQFLAARVDALDQRVRLDDLERECITLRRLIAEHRGLIKTLPLKYASQIEDYERAIALAEQELTQSETLREWVITAPEAGTATAVVGEPGQTTDANRPLLAIVPAGAKLQAHLYANSKAIGFVEPGDLVYVRFQAYPHQKFGHHSGRVSSVSHSAASAAELIGADAASSIFNKGEPLYRITVDLSGQEVRAYGKRQPLQAGMLVEADILQETRRLYEWILEPLYALGSRVR